MVYAAPGLFFILHVVIGSRPPTPPVVSGQGEVTPMGGCGGHDTKVRDMVEIGGRTDDMMESGRGGASDDTQRVGKRDEDENVSTRPNELGESPVGDLDPPENRETSSRAEKEVDGQNCSCGRAMMSRTC